MGLTSAFTCCFPCLSKGSSPVYEDDYYSPPIFDEKSPLLITNRGYTCNETREYPTHNRTCSDRPDAGYCEYEPKTYHDEANCSQEFPLSPSYRCVEDGSFQEHPPSPVYRRYSEDSFQDFPPFPAYHHDHDDYQAQSEIEDENDENKASSVLSLDLYRGQSDQDKAKDIISILLSSDDPFPTDTLRADMRTAIATSGFTRWLAEKVLERLEVVLQKSLRDEEYQRTWGRAFTHAVEEANDVARAIFHELRDFVDRHPDKCEAALGVLATVVALGVLVQVAPVVLELLGFAELGPVEGSFAAYWESTYGGTIPAGSLFSYFQRLGMTWGHM